MDILSNQKSMIIDCGILLFPTLCMKIDLTNAVSCSFLLCPGFYILHRVDLCISPLTCILNNLHKTWLSEREKRKSIEG